MNLKRNLLIASVILFTWIGNVYCQRPDMPPPARRAAPNDGTIPPGLDIDQNILMVLLVALVFGIIMKMVVLKKERL